MSLSDVWSEIRMLFASPDAQLSEAVRRFKARDDLAAIRLARRAARHSDLAKVIVAQWMAMQRDPEIVREAARLLQIAANNGLKEAQQVLSAWYFHGTGVPQDKELAYQWTKRAADAGMVPSQIAMVEYLTSGEEREEDLEGARHYAEMAAAAGHPHLLAALVQAEHQLKAEQRQAQSESDEPDGS
jgi:TPR repeat protein